MTKLTSSHYLRKMNGALSPRDFQGAFIPQTSSKLGQDPLWPSRFSVICLHYKLSLICHQKASIFSVWELWLSLQLFFLSGLFTSWGHIIKSGNYSIYFISRRSLSSPQNSIIIWGKQLQLTPTFWPLTWCLHTGETATGYIASVSPSDFIPQYFTIAVKTYKM